MLMNVLRSVKNKHFIRLFQQTDAVQCCKIINACLQDMDGLNMTARQYVRDKNHPSTLFKELNQYYSLVYSKADVIIGLGSLDENEIKRMYTSPQYQKQGVGQAILHNLEIKAKLQGINKLILQSSPSAVGFYQKYGFIRLKPGSTVIGAAVFHYVTMEKRLEK